MASAAIVMRNGTTRMGTTKKDILQNFARVEAEQRELLALLEEELVVKSPKVRGWERCLALIHLRRIPLLKQIVNGKRVNERRRDIFAH
jgi:hypothetical protein